MDEQCECGAIRCPTHGGVGVDSLLENADLCGGQASKEVRVAPLQRWCVGHAGMVACRPDTF